MDSDLFILECPNAPPSQLIACPLVVVYQSGLITVGIPKHRHAGRFCARGWPTLDCYSVTPDIVMRSLGARWSEGAERRR